MQATITCRTNISVAEFARQLFGKMEILEVHGVFSILDDATLMEIYRGGLDRLGFAAARELTYRDVVLIPAMSSFLSTPSKKHEDIMHAPKKVPRKCPRVNFPPPIYTSSSELTTSSATASKNSAFSDESEMDLFFQE